MIEKELLMHAIACNAIRALILRSAVEHRQELGRLSFKGAVDLLRQWLPQAAACYNLPRKLASWHRRKRCQAFSTQDLCSRLVIKGSEA